MHSAKDLSIQNNGSDKTFIEQARRHQIIEATVDTLAQYGYVNTSFARIAQHVGISPSLISYHFKNKEELTNEVFNSIALRRVNYVTERVERAASATDKLRVALESDLANMGTQPKYFHALNEILFSMRGKNGALTYLGDGHITS